MRTDTLISVYGHHHPDYQEAIGDAFTRNSRADEEIRKIYISRLFRWGRTGRYVRGIIRESCEASSAPLQVFAIAWEFGGRDRD